MRILLILGYSLLWGISFSQSNELRLRANQFSYIDLSEEVNTDDIELFRNPTERDISRNFNLDISFIYKSQFLFRIGYGQINQNGTLIQVRDTSYIMSDDSFNRSDLSFSIGLIHAVSFDDSNFEINGGLNLSTLFKFNRQAKFESFLFNQDNKHLSSAVRELDYPNSLRFGLNFELIALYYIKGKFGIGIDFAPSIYLDYVNGSTFDKRIILDEELNEVDNLEIARVEKELRLGKSFNYSIITSYRF